jgi:hypothetical protein
MDAVKRDILHAKKEAKLEQMKLREAQGLPPEDEVEEEQEENDVPAEEDEEEDSNPDRQTYIPVPSASAREVRNFQSDKFK